MQKLPGAIAALVMATGPAMAGPLITLSGGAPNSGAAVINLANSASAALTGVVGSGGRERVGLTQGATGDAAVLGASPGGGARILGRRTPPGLSRPATRPGSGNGRLSAASNGALESLLKGRPGASARAALGLIERSGELARRERTHAAGPHGGCPATCRPRLPLSAMLGMFTSHRRAAGGGAHEPARTISVASGSASTGGSRHIRGAATRRADHHPGAAVNRIAATNTLARPADELPARIASVEWLAGHGGIKQGRDASAGRRSTRKGGEASPPDLSRHRVHSAASAREPAALVRYLNSPLGRVITPLTRVTNASGLINLTPFIVLLFVPALIALRRFLLTGLRGALQVEIDYQGRGNNASGTQT